ncbi:MAG: ATP-binding protein [Prevotellaceae bacterium]|jgi:AAA15 family ATPase/GTPase|nr:ATP-binding protein [Prevotellaceae bacterium]
MFPNIKRPTFSHHIYTDIEVPLLKQAAIYGANGSGKSNFIKAMSFLREFITQEDFLQSVDLNDYIFQLTQEKSQIISFEIEFLHKEKYYIYSVDISPKEVAEKLSISGLGKSENKLLFERNGNMINSSYLQNETSAKQLLERRSYSSIMSLNKNYPVIINNDINSAFDWFSKQLEIITINSQIPILIGFMSQQPKLLKFANEVFENIGIGIKSVEIKESDFDKWTANPENANFLKQVIEKNPKQDNFEVSQLKSNRNVLNFQVQKGIRTVQEFVFEQLGQSGYHKKMNILSQSDGTVRLLTLIPAFYEAMFQNKTVVIDEIDNSIHPNLMFELIRFYANNKSNGQLIFTTHTTKLLNQQELVRPDEIWLAEKSEGDTKMFSLNDFKLHNTLNIENGYLDGRYGAVPVMKELNVE